VPDWTPSRIWNGGDCYIIGGGASLRSFDWELIRGKHTVGCNGAFSLGHEICQFCVFADIKWWEEVGEEGLAEYGGLAVACSPRFHSNTNPWLQKVKRSHRKKLATDCFGWFGNTGALAINLALILGAQRLLLLGFDMKLDEKAEAKKRANWHDLRYEAENPQVYSKFAKQFDPLAVSLPKVFPGREIINVTNDSNLETFPKVSLAEHFRKDAA